MDLPVPAGTSGAMLRKCGRSALMALILLAPLTLWWPSVPGWGALVVAVGAVWLCWLCSQIAAGRADVPGHWIHAVLVGVMVLVAVHLADQSFRPPTPSAYAIGGEFNASLLVHLGIVVLLVMLTQDLIGRGVVRPGGCVLLGAAVLVGALTGLAAARPAEGRLMLAMMGWTGVGLFGWPLGPLRGSGRGLRLRWALRAARLAIVLVAAVALAVACPAGIAAATLAGAVGLTLAAWCVPRHRLATGLGALAAGVSAVIQAWALGWAATPRWPTGLGDWLGRGERVLLTVNPWQSGPGLILGALGWLGAGAAAIGLLLCLTRMAWRPHLVKKGARRPVIMTILVVAGATGALLVPGGLFSPAINVLFAVTWAVVPMALGRRIRRRSGWWLMIISAAVLLTLGLTRQRGLTRWIIDAYGRGDDTLHLLAGGLVTLQLLWLLGRRRAGLYVALGLSLAAAVSGEFAQQLLSSHQAELKDVGSHLAGAGVALLLFALCRASRWDEYTDQDAQVEPAGTGEPPGASGADDPAHRP